MALFSEAGLEAAGNGGATMKNKWICPNCGYPNDDTAKKCWICGELRKIKWLRR